MQTLNLTRLEVDSLSFILTRLVGGVVPGRTAVRGVATPLRQQDMLSIWSILKKLEGREDD